MNKEKVVITDGPVTFTELKPASIFARLQHCRVELAKTEIKKGGENKFAGYKYFELSDFLPSINRLFAEVNLCGITTFTRDEARLTIHDTTGTGETIIFTSPMEAAALKGAHPIQNLGAVQTYQRRYLYMAALEITEPDAIDGSKPAEKTEPAKPQTKQKMECTDAIWLKLWPRIQSKETGIIQKIRETYNLTPDQEITLQENEF